MSFWTRVLDLGLADRSHIVVEFSESPEHIAQMAAPDPWWPAPVPVEPVPNPAPVEPAPAPEEAVPEPGPGQAPRYNAIFGIGGDGDDWLVGDDQGPGNDVLRGDAGNDALTGGSGNVDLWGGAGDDVLVGGPGADRLWGRQHLGDAEGNDVFRYEALGEMDGDVISGFWPGSTIDFRPLQQIDFRGTGAFEATGRAQLRYEVQDSPEFIRLNVSAGMAPFLRRANVVEK